MSALLKPAEMSALPKAAVPASTDNQGQAEEKSIVMVPCLICDVPLNNSEDDITQHLYDAHGKIKQPTVERPSSIYIKANVCVCVCVYALYAFRNRRRDPDQTLCGAPSCPRARLRLPGSRKFRAPGVPPLLRGRGDFGGKGPLGH